MLNRPYKFIRKIAKKLILEALDKFNVEDHKLDIEDVPENIKGDISSSVCFPLAKTFRKGPKLIAEDVCKKIKKNKYFQEYLAIGGYINFVLDKNEYSKLVFKLYKSDFGKIDIGKGEKLIIEHTSANPTGQLHIGNARNVLIGDSLARIFKSVNYDLEVQYYINDMGKQVAFLVLALDKYKIDESKKKDKALGEIYRRSTEIEEDRAIDYLKKYEKMETEIESKFKKVVDLCLYGQKETFKRINVYYNKFIYESDFLKDGSVAKVVEKLKNSKYAKKEDGAIYLDLSEFGIDERFIILRSDGTTLYTTRDIAYHLYKLKNAKKVVDVLGEDQKVAFNKLVCGLKILEQKILPQAVFYSHITLPSGKMSKRKGKGVYLDEFIDEATKRAYSEVQKRRSELDENKKKMISEILGIGAIKFEILSTSPEKAIVFSWERALDFEKQGIPFIEYAHARCCSILKNEKSDEYNLNYTLTDSEFRLIKILSKYPDILKKAAINLKPNLLCNYCISLVKNFNTFYLKNPVLKSDQNIKKSRLFLVNLTKNVINSCLNLLGIESLDEM